MRGFYLCKMWVKSASNIRMYAFPAPQFRFSPSTVYRFDVSFEILVIKTGESI